MDRYKQRIVSIGYSFIHTTSHCWLRTFHSSIRRLFHVGEKTVNSNTAGAEIQLMDRVEFLAKKGMGLRLSPLYNSSDYYKIMACKKTCCRQYANEKCMSAIILHIVSMG